MFRYYLIALLYIVSASASAVSDLVVETRGGGQILALGPQTCPGAQPELDFKSVELKGCTVWNASCIITKEKELKMTFIPKVAAVNPKLRLIFTPTKADERITTKEENLTPAWNSVINKDFTFTLKGMESFDIKNGDMNLQVEVLNGDKGERVACHQGTVKWSSQATPSTTCGAATGISGSIAAAAIALLGVFKNL